MSTRLPDEEIAYHEAGHAVMSIIEGLPFITVTIDQDGADEGHVDPGDTFRLFQDRMLRYRLANTDDVSLIRKYVKVIYAGPMSHGLFLRVESWWNYLIGGNDNAHVYQLMEVAYQTEPLITNMCGDARMETMLEIDNLETQEMINKIAIALLEHRILTYQQCKNLL